MKALDLITFFDVRDNSIARLETGHTPSRKHPEYWSGSIPWVGIKDARENHGKVICDTHQKATQLGIDNSAARILPAGTVCLSRTASVGYAVVLGTERATSQDFVDWICTDAVDPKWLMYLLLAEEQSLPKFGKGTTHTTIYFPEVLAFYVCLPPKKEQQEIVKRIEEMCEFVKSIETCISDVHGPFDQLDQAILAKAFRGELVPQDSTDEPASVLLDRIREQRAQRAEAIKARKKTAKTQPRNGMGKKSSGLALRQQPKADAQASRGQPSLRAAMVQVLIEREWGAMSDIRTQEQAQKIGWTPHLIRQLRGKRTQAAFGALLGAAKSTLWRWKARQVRPVPDIQHV